MFPTHDSKVVTTENKSMMYKICSQALPGCRQIYFWIKEEQHIILWVGSRPWFQFLFILDPDLQLANKDDEGLASEGSSGWITISLYFPGTTRAGITGWKVTTEKSTKVWPWGTTMAGPTSWKVKAEKSTKVWPWGTMMAGPNGWKVKAIKSTWVWPQAWNISWTMINAALKTLW